MSETVEFEYVLGEADVDAMAAALVRDPKPMPPADRAAGASLAATAATFAAVIVAGWTIDAPAWLLWLAAALLAVVLLALLLNPAAWLLLGGLGLLVSARRKRVRAELRRGCADLLGTPIRWTVDAEAIAVQSVRGDRRIPWPQLRRAEIHATHWLLTLADKQEVVVPADRLPEAAVALIRQRAAAAGATVRDVR